MHRLLCNCSRDLQLKDRGIDGFSTMAFKAADDDVENLFSYSHLLGVIVPGPLQRGKKRYCSVQNISL